MTGLRFSAVVGQDEAKLALLLAAARPRLGGVLLRGDKGSAKTTLARGLAGVLPGEAPFVELPLGATEERVIGSLDLAELLTNGQPRFRPGLLASAHGGVLYVDEINLLADHLVDALLDVAVSGLNRVERDGLSHTHAARFVLVGSMNPEEGELRPQLLDRFGLAVDVRAASTAGERREVVRRQLAAEATAGAWDAPDTLRGRRCPAPGPAAPGPRRVGRASRRGRRRRHAARPRGGRRGPAGRPHALPGGAGACRPRRPRRGSGRRRARRRRHGARSPPAPPALRRAGLRGGRAGAGLGRGATSPDAGDLTDRASRSSARPTVLLPTTLTTSRRARPRWRSPRVLAPGDRRPTRAGSARAAARAGATGGRSPTTSSPVGRSTPRPPPSRWPAAGRSPPSPWVWRSTTCAAPSASSASPAWWCSSSTLRPRWASSGGWPRPRRPCSACSATPTAGGARWR